MPAGLPGARANENTANPNAGRSVLFNPLSGLKGSLLDRDNANNASTGALSTGIGFGVQETIRLTDETKPATIERAILDAGFEDDELPGDGPDSSIVFIGGGRSGATIGGRAETLPYTEGFQLASAGDGVDRDSYHVLKMVTAVAEVPFGGVVEAGWENRSPDTLAVGDSVFGVSGGSQLVGPVLSNVFIGQNQAVGTAPTLSGVSIDQGDAPTIGSITLEQA